ncbi:MAG: hypothetical protein LBT46_15430 [Planctomycetaceae bacterium]|jgi:hypothetical protein|nr:hypothetical protein [Planctomycetaceae bacterium]
MEFAEYLPHIGYPFAIIVCFTLLVYMILAILGKAPVFKSRNISLSLDRQEDDDVYALYKIGEEVRHVDNNLTEIMFRYSVNPHGSIAGETLKPDWKSDVECSVFLTSLLRNHITSMIESTGFENYLNGKIAFIRQRLSARDIPYTDDEVAAVVAAWGDVLRLNLSNAVRIKIALYQSAYEMYILSKSAKRVLDELLMKNNRYLKALE